MATGRKLGTVSLVLSAGIFLGVNACTTADTPAGNTVQGWDADQRSSWYQGTQGSRLLPLSWARALEQAASQELFFTDASLANILRGGVLAIRIEQVRIPGELRELRIRRRRMLMIGGEDETAAGVVEAICHR